MREAIKSHGQPTPLNAPTVKRRTRCDVCIRHLCGEARRHSTFVLVKTECFLTGSNVRTPTHKEDKICTSMTKNQT